MIVDMPSTTVSKIGKRLQELREAGGVVALGRVLTLIVETDLENLEAAVNAANGASKLHPSRIIVLAKDQGKGGKERQGKVSHAPRRCEKYGHLAVLPRAKQTPNE